MPSLKNTGLIFLEIFLIECCTVLVKPPMTSSLYSQKCNYLQPRSQGLSSLPPLVVGRKTLVAAGHMTTQNLGGKKICWVGGVAEYFVWLM